MRYHEHTIPDFMHVDEEDMIKFSDQIEWLPERQIELIRRDDND